MENLNIFPRNGEKRKSENYLMFLIITITQFLRALSIFYGTPVSFMVGRSLVVSMAPVKNSVISIKIYFCNFEIALT